MSLYINNRNDSTILYERLYEDFNEIVNETLSQLVTSKLHDKGNYIFNSKENAKIIGGSDYQKTGFLVHGFIEKYLKEIIDSRLHGDINIILNKVGEENFERLNNLFSKFKEYFPGYTFYTAMKDLEQGKDNDLVRKYKELINERDIVLKDMEEYSLESIKGVSL